MPHSDRAMNMNASNETHKNISLPPTDLPAEAIHYNDKVTPSQAHTIVKRLARIIEETMDEGLSAEVMLSMRQVVQVVDRAIDHAEHSSDERFSFDHTEHVYMNDLLDELNAQRGHIFDVATDDDGEAYYVPLSHKLWTYCLHQLRDQLASHVEADT